MCSTRHMRVALSSTLLIGNDWFHSENRNETLPRQKVSLTTISLLEAWNESMVNAASASRLASLEPDLGPVDPSTSTFDKLLITRVKQSCRIHHRFCNYPHSQISRGVESWNTTSSELPYQLEGSSPLSFLCQGYTFKMTAKSSR